TGYFFGKETVNEKIVAQISGTLGADTALQIKEMLSKAGRSGSTVFGSIIGITILLVGATGVFVELQKTLNMIWQVKAVPQKGILLFFKSRLFSFGLILAIAFLLLISLVLSTALAAMGGWISRNSSDLVVDIFECVNFLFSIAVISVLFALMFKILPDAKIEWKHVWLGSLLTGLLFTIGKTALAFYFGKAHPASAYGAAGSIILILLWVSYSSMILFFGAEFTAAYASLYSGKVLPSEIARNEGGNESNKYL
ncbi:MAG: YihY/virulence factor BrkB family protein, partial [Bacteroidia bacterium]|nr:YihY/virulence factor BrkB family protein [Bacteroidia bacterium]